MLAVLVGSKAAFWTKSLVNLKDVWTVLSLVDQKALAKLNGS